MIECEIILSLTPLPRHLPAYDTLYFPCSLSGLLTTFISKVRADPWDSHGSHHHTLLLSPKVLQAFLCEVREDRSYVIYTIYSHRCVGELLLANVWHGLGGRGAFFLFVRFIFIVDGRGMEEMKQETTTTTTSRFNFGSFHTSSAHNNNTLKMFIYHDNQSSR